MTKLSNPELKTSYFHRKFRMPFKIEVDYSQQHPIITLTNPKNNNKAVIYAFGGLLNSFSIPINGESFNVIDAYQSVEDAQKNITDGFRSARLSPFTCRLNKGKYTYNNHPYRVEKFFMGPHAIHGITFDAVYEIKETSADDHSASVILHYQYTGFDKGYPFAYDVTLTWKLETGNKLSVHSAINHSNPQTIPYAEGWHPYFKLGTDVNECTLQFDSDTQLEFDETLLPTGKEIKDDRFQHGTLLKDTFLDNCYELNDSAHPKCVLSNKQIQLTIMPESSYPYLQVYTPSHRKSMAIENLSGAPDAFNNGIGLKLLVPNHTYTFATSYTLKAL